jgi:hypothetical protein
VFGAFYHDRGWASTEVDARIRGEGGHRIKAGTVVLPPMLVEGGVDTAETAGIE